MTIKLWVGDVEHNLRNKEPLFEYYEVIIMVVTYSNFKKNPKEDVATYMY